MQGLDKGKMDKVCNRCERQVSTKLRQSRMGNRKICSACYILEDIEIVEILSNHSGQWSGKFEYKGGDYA